MGLFSFFRIWLFFLGIFNLADGGKLLVVPMDGSHWLSMRHVVERLAQKGHQVVMVMPESSLSISGSELYTVKIYPVFDENKDMKAHLQEFGRKHFIDPPFPGAAYTMLKDMQELILLFHKVCESLLSNKHLISDLREEKFDAVLTDPAWVCGLILAEDLGIPYVGFLRGLPCAYEYVSAQCDSPLSYVPRIFTKNSDSMTFIQRVENVLVKLIEPYYCDFLFQPFESLASNFLNRKVTLLDLYSKSSIWLLRYDFIFEYPRPIMPNMIFVGGINCVKQKSLPKVGVNIRNEFSWSKHVYKKGKLNLITN
ncbi:UDP-glucuronosyltransferase 1A6-like [Aquarana catesbeiana]|uniref:UDP-glucuronosyltransferase 1A6-like n=1 Tax=Aquarana catesbeiana TaxID=8400 RepID=UPI003CC9B716